LVEYTIINSNFDQWQVINDGKLNWTYR